ncbi:hypothetical protein ACQR16_11390 [Bradyrhizobium oligotrophicum]|uniref:hypothetical protein n=1 Tax=Bradyrhizobium oligotrophicum TaxID=44255 RepID=UPI003EBE7B6F
MCSLPRRCRLLLLLIALAAPMAARPAGAQSGDRSGVADAFLVRQDNSDCTNSDVKADDPSRIGGTVQVTRQADGKLRVKIAITAAPDTTYHFFLKCVRSLGDVKTEDEGQGAAEFELSADGAPPVLAFDMYPEGAPSGQKFQSTSVKLP